jgi:phytoene dehydrogenase-like protein
VPEAVSVARIHSYSLSKSTWAEQRESLKDGFLSRLDEYVPNIRNTVEFIEVLTTWDIKRVFGINQCHVSHIEQSLNQMLSFRPVLGWSNYRLPVQGLYLCGAGTHPSGGVTGAPGHNAAQTVIQDFVSRRVTATQ